MFQFYEKNGKYGLYNTNSIKYTMLCAAAEKDKTTLHTIYNKLSPTRQQSIIISGRNWFLQWTK